MTFVPLINGSIGLIKGFKNFPESEKFSRNQVLYIDNEWRFHSGLSLGIGIILVCMILNIENHQYGFCYDILMGIVAFSGIGRLISLLQRSKILPKFIAPIIAEFIFCPLFIIWHNCIL